MEIPNLNYIQEISDGDEAFEKQLLDILKKELPIEIENYFNALQKLDYQEIIASVHKLKHKISILGLEKGYELAASYEEKLKNSNLELQQSFENILNILSNFLKQH